jgi:curved DNA-binding protein CbpA
MEVVRAAYKALVFIHHPDRGGSTARMQEINAAFGEIKGKR